MKKQIMTLAGIPAILYGSRSRKVYLLSLIHICGSKPYQQHVTKPMFAMPNYLKLKGYQTAAVHCFWAKYWSRDKMCIRDRRYPARQRLRV